MDHQPAQSQSGCKQRRPNHIPAVTPISPGSTGGRVDATTDEEIARQAAAIADTASVFTTDEILAAGRRILPEDVADVRALRTRPGLSQEALAARFGAWLNSEPATDVAEDCFGPRCRPTSCGEGLFRRS